PPLPAAVHEAAEVAGQAPRGERSAAGGDRVADRRGVLVQLSGEPGLGGAAERTEDVEFAREAGQRALRVEPTAHGRDTPWPGAIGTRPTRCQFGTDSRPSRVRAVGVAAPAGDAPGRLPVRRRASRSAGRRRPPAPTATRRSKRVAAGRGGGP